MYIPKCCIIYKYIYIRFNKLLGINYTCYIIILFLALLRHVRVDFIQMRLPIDGLYGHDGPRIQ